MNRIFWNWMALFIVPRCALDSTWDYTPNNYIRFSGRKSQAFLFFKISLGDSDNTLGSRNMDLWELHIQQQKSFPGKCHTHTSTINLSSSILKALICWHQREMAGISKPRCPLLSQTPGSNTCTHKLKVTRSSPHWKSTWANQDTLWVDCSLIQSYHPQS